jgi:hypothetical protein
VGAPLVDAELLDFFFFPNIGFASFRTREAARFACAGAYRFGGLRLAGLSEFALRKPFVLYEEIFYQPQHGPRSAAICRVQSFINRFHQVLDPSRDGRRASRIIEQGKQSARGLAVQRLDVFGVDLSLSHLAPHLGSLNELQDRAARLFLLDGDALVIFRH